MRSAVRLDTLETSVETSPLSAGNFCGASICHLPAASFFITVVSPSRGLSSIWLILLSSMARILGVSGLGLSLLASSFRLDHHTTPPRPARATAAMSKRVVFMTAYDLRRHHTPRPAATINSG